MKVELPIFHLIGLLPFGSASSVNTNTLHVKYDNCMNKEEVYPHYFFHI
jgi:hypothetical protein